jgi:hypothetical protein|tara:strand:+ start:254 stop:895 length:642 start_codon:yes stop_codon:yes gene_type:complete
MLRLIILNYKRPDNVKKIVFSLKKIFPKITIINNNPEYFLPYYGNGVDVINNQRNFFCMERWIRCFEYPEEFKLIIDDDILPSPQLIKNMVKSNLPITGIYGKRGVSFANSYDELKDVWSVGNVDFLVGSIILVKQSVLNEIQTDLEKLGYPERGDDIIVSYLIKRTFQTSLKLTQGQFMFLPEGDVGLNKSKEHFIKRWNVIKKFQNIGWTD